MKLVELRLQNFRQFYGEQVIEFAGGADDRNITVLHGYNGSGKTALLNSFVWCLYGETTPDLEAPERLANERALAESDSSGKVKIGVQLRFRARGETFVAERTAVATCDADGKWSQSDSKLTLRRIDASGESESLKAPELMVNQLLPKDLYPFFFFNGERVEHLASPKAYDEVEQGIKTLLDVEIYERTSRHLRDWVYKELSKELRDIGDAETQDVVDQREARVTELERLTAQADQLTKNAAELSEEIELIEQRQRDVAEVAELTAKRDAARQRLLDNDERIRRLQSDSARHLSKDGYLAFCEPIFAKTHTLIAEARQRGELPAKVKPQFVDDLLSAGECICGRPLEQGTDPYTKLVGWRGVTGLAALEESISQTHASLGSLRTRRASYFDEVKRVQADLSAAHGNKRRLSDEVAELNAKIGDPKRSLDAAALEQKRQALMRQRENTLADLKVARRDIEKTEGDIKWLQKQIDELEMQNEKAQLIQHQMHVVDNIAEAFQEIYELQKQDVRQELAANVEEIWRDAAVKDYHASVSEDFRLELTKSVGGELQPVHGASTGEKQVLSLSFVGSLVRKARQNEEKSLEQPGGLIAGGEYPLVMDSPFGALEDDYRRKVAEWVPTLASQVVVMASKTQWREEVESAMRSRIGREYILELHTPKGDSDRQIEIDGHAHTYVQCTPGKLEQTVIKEVN